MANCLAITAVFLLNVFCANYVYCDIGFVVMSNTVNSHTIEECSAFNPKFAQYLVALDNHTKGQRVVDIYPSTGCSQPLNPALYKERIVIMKRHPNCTFVERARIVQSNKGLGVIVVSDTGISTPGGNQTDYDQINISLSLVTNESYAEFSSVMQSAGIDNVFIKMYSPKQNYYDPNSFIMWFIAVFTCSFGAWLQATHYASQMSRPSTTPTPSGTMKDKKENGGGEELTVTLTHAVVFFGMCSISILLMYFFYDYLVYVIIGIFCFASCLATFDLIFNVFQSSSCFTRHRIPPNKIPVLRSRPPVFAIVLFLCCAGFSIFWAINRKASYAWILQDVLGFTFCIHMIKQIRLPSFKISSLLLVLFFLYDIFYVFVTPYLTKNKESIMVHIATGGSGTSNEELPMLFKLPRFFKSIYAKCGPMPYSMLGYGDVILPGLHVGFCAVWDVRISNTVRRHAYFIAAVIGYGTGLILTFVGMYLMKMGQPALLYLSPCCLFSTLVVALKRNELRAIWGGDLTSKMKVTPTSQSVGDEQETLLDKVDA